MARERWDTNAELKQSTQDTAVDEEDAGYARGDLDDALARIRAGAAAEPTPELEAVFRAMGLDHTGAPPQSVRILEHAQEEAAAMAKAMAPSEQLMADFRLQQEASSRVAQDMNARAMERVSTAMMAAPDPGMESVHAIGNVHELLVANVEQTATQIELAKSSDARILALIGVMEAGLQRQAQADRRHEIAERRTFYLGVAVALLSLPVLIDALRWLERIIWPVSP